MRLLGLWVVMFSLFAFVAPALAVDDIYGPQGGSSDPRRPDLGISRSRHGASPWEESYKQEIDFSGFMARLYEVLSTDELLGQYPQVKQIADLYKEMGVFNMGTSLTEYEISGDNISFFTSTGFNDLDPACFYARYFALEDQELDSARYIAREDVLLYLGVTNLPQKLMLQVEEMQSVAARMGGAEDPLHEIFGELGGGDAEQIWGLVTALRLDQVVSSVLSGEVALAVYGLPEVPKFVHGDLQPSDLDVALFIGIKDAAYLQQMIDNYGSGIGLTSAGEQDGWQRFTLADPPGMSVTYNDELLVACSNAEKFAAHMDAAKGGKYLRVDPCQFYFDLDAQRLEAEFGKPLWGMAAEEFGPEVKLPSESVAYLLNLPQGEELGHIKLMANHDNDGGSWEMSMNKAVVQYFLYYVGVLGCGAAQSDIFY